MVEFNASLTNITQHGGPSFWQATEGYLHVGQKTYTVKSLNNKNLKVEATNSKTSLLWTVIKVLSYATIVLPVIALIARQIYRHQHTIDIQSPTDKTGDSTSEKPFTSMAQFNQRLKTIHANFQIAKKAVESNEGLSTEEKEKLIDVALKEAIDSFKSTYENRHSPNQETVTITKLFHDTLMDSFPSLETVTGQLNFYLKNLSSYKKSQDEVLKMVFKALKTLKNTPVSQENIEISRTILKKVSTFLRKNTKSDKLASYQDYLKADTNQRFLGASSYEYIDLKSSTSQRKHAALLFHLKHLRKNIKLLTRQVGLIGKITKASPELLKDVPQEKVEQAFQYLNLSWIHGTKASVIKSAMEKTGGKLVPSGQMGKYQVKVITGEMLNGATAEGINRQNLSGVSLQHATMSVDYAKSFKFDLAEEKKYYQKLLTFDPEKVSGLSDSNGILSRPIEALKRLYHLSPETIKADFPKLKEVIKICYKEVRDYIFKKDMNSQIFDWHDYCFTSDLYNYLKAVQKLEEFISNPPSPDPITEEEQALANIPIVLASSTQYGLPIGLNSDRESEEEVYRGELTIGDDLQVVFASDEDVDKLKTLLEKQGMQDKVKVEPLSILVLANKIDQALSEYFYDPYNIEKWKKGM